MFDVQVALFLGVLNISGSILQGATGFGDAIVMHILWEVAVKIPLFAGALHATPLGRNDVAVVSIMTYFRVLCVNPTIIYLNRHEKLSVRIFCIMVVTQCVSGVAAELLLDRINVGALKVAFAALMMTVAVLFTAIKLRAHRLHLAERRAENYFDADGHPHRSLQLAIGAAGCVGGVSGSLFGVVGPPFMLVILYFNLPASLSRRTFISAFLVAGIARFAAAAAAGVVTTAMLPYAIVICSCGLLGLFTGQKCARKMSNAMFTSLILSFLILASVAMLPLPPEVLISCFVAVCAVLVVIHFQGAAMQGPWSQSATAPKLPLSIATGDTKVAVACGAATAGEASVGTPCGSQNSGASDGAPSASDTPRGSSDRSGAAASPSRLRFVSQAEDARTSDVFVELLPVPIPSDEEWARQASHAQKR